MKEEPRFFVDTRVGCIAIRDRLHPDFDPDHLGLDSDLPDIVKYAAGVWKENDWCIPEDVKVIFDVECNALNKNYNENFMSTEEELKCIVSVINFLVMIDEESKHVRMNRMNNILGQNIPSSFAMTRMLEKHNHDITSFTLYLTGEEKKWETHIAEFLCSIQALEFFTHHMKNCIEKLAKKEKTIIMSNKFGL